MLHASSSHALASPPLPPCAHPTPHNTHGLPSTVHGIQHTMRARNYVLQNSATAPMRSDQIRSHHTGGNSALPVGRQCHAASKGRAAAPLMVTGGARASAVLPRQRLTQTQPAIGRHHPGLTASHSQPASHKRAASNAKLLQQSSCSRAAQQTKHALDSPSMPDFGSDQ